MTVEVIEIRKTILSAANGKRRKGMFEAARKLEYLSLQFEILPEEIFLIYLDVLSDPEICQTPGVDEFVSGLFNDFDKLSNDKKTRLCSLFLNNADIFFLPMLRLSISDLIARKYPVEMAVNIFSELWVYASDYSREMALSGVQILLGRKNLTSMEQSCVKDLKKLINGET
jgi:hypothetical protein